MIRFSGACDTSTAPVFPAGVPDSGGVVVTGGVDGVLHMPAATRLLKSGVTTRSVTRIGVSPQDSRCLPSASYLLRSQGKIEFLSE